MTYAIVLAAGIGQRMQSDQPKQFLDLAGAPLLIHTLDAFEACEGVDAIVVVTGSDDTDAVASLVDGYAKVRVVVTGGKERQDSVAEGLKAVPSDADLIAVHDGARPLILPTEIDAVLYVILKRMRARAVFTNIRPKWSIPGRGSLLSLLAELFRRRR
mgnify:CR=1 FL=1